MVIFGFDDFWNAYPKKKAKAAAQKAFAKAEFNGELDSVIAALKAQVAACKDLTYFPHAATWINGRRWEDQLTDATEAKPANWSAAIC